MAAPLKAIPFENIDPVRRIQQLRFLEVRKIFSRPKTDRCKIPRQPRVLQLRVFLSHTLNYRASLITRIAWR